MLAIALNFYSIPVAGPSLSFRAFGYNNSAWLGTAFLASFPIGLLVWPSLCKGFGYKFSFVVAIEAFNVASTYAATCKTAERLIALRLIAGAGAGGACGLFDVSPLYLIDHSVSIKPSVASDVWKDDIEGYSPAEGSRKIHDCFLGDLGRDCGCQPADGRSIGLVSPKDSLTSTLPH